MFHLIFLIPARLHNRLMSVQNYTPGVGGLTHTHNCLCIQPNDFKTFGGKGLPMRFTIIEQEESGLLLAPPLFQRKLQPVQTHHLANIPN